MDFFDFLTMIGGLALFLYGMHLLGEGLAKAAGGKFERILEKLTDNPLKAVVVGAGVTAVIQSSSAATVMVVGFVNSGIMKLQQAVGIIMGANVGTTITSWILGAQGIDSDSFLVRLCKPTSFSPILALTGVVLMSVSRRGAATQEGTVSGRGAVSREGKISGRVAAAQEGKISERGAAAQEGKISGRDVVSRDGTMSKRRTAYSRDRLKNIGVVMVGFAILMFGMDTMSSAVKPLAQVPEFTGILTRFTNPFLGVLAGTILTAVLQSSSASVGILQALCATGAVGYRAAIPIIMGQNIGTCVTAMLSGMGAGRNAKRAALVHLYFNLIGTILFMLLFYMINAVRPFAFLDGAATPFGIAAVHSVFNILSTLFLLPFSGGLVKLACLSIREEASSEEEEGISGVSHLLDVRFLEVPSYAVERSRTVAGMMAGLAEESMYLAMELLGAYGEETAEKVVALECRVDALEDELGSYLMKLSTRDMPERDSHTLSTILHCISDFERISDHARNIKEAAEEMAEKGLRFSEKAGEELEIFSEAIGDILDLAMRSFREGNLQLARQVEPLEEVIDGLNRDIRRRHGKRLRKGKCTIELGFLLSDITTNLERVSDHCSNIAVCMLQANDEEFDTHAYLDRLKQEDNIEFRGKVLAYGERYKLP